MHEYATDVDRNKIVIWLAIVTIAVTVGVNALVQKWMIQFPWWLDSPSIMLFYGVIYALYNQLLWKIHISTVSLSSIPYVGGVWAGVLTSSYNNGTKIDIVLYIKQTWSKISIRTETETSTSFTTMAAFNTEDNLDPGLKYEYLSEPGAFAKETMHIHKGTGHLSLSSDNKTLIGEYYTGRGRQTFGTLELHFVSKKKVSREEALRLLMPRPIPANN